MKRRLCYIVALAVFVIFFSAAQSWAWHDETHIAIAKVSGYKKWFNACGADMAKLKAGQMEKGNHYVNNPPGKVVTPKMVQDQVIKYNQIDMDGHLYGAIIASLRDYIRDKTQCKYGEYHLAFCSHYIGDLSMPLHNTGLFDSFNQKHHKEMDGIINDEVLNHLNEIRVYPISIDSEEDLAKEIARIANLSMALGYRLEREQRLLTREEAYTQISHSASLFKAVLVYSERLLKSRQ